MAGIVISSPRRGNRFSAVAAAFLTQPGLPFAEVLSPERIERVFTKHGNLFGFGAVYSTAVTLWAFLAQVLHDGKEASCRAAVAGVIAYRDLLDLAPPTDDTGDYCRARAKLCEAALHELAGEVAAETEDRAEPSWLFCGSDEKGLHAKLIDGFTFTMPDTPRNQAAYPQQKSQKRGVGLPIARVAAVVSLATGCLLGAALGAYQGKRTGEPALLRRLLDLFGPGDVAVADRCYCSFMMIAMLFGRGSHACFRMHQSRHTDFRRGRRLGKYDHRITWVRPSRPPWMSEDVYATIPPVLEMREIRYRVVESGRRTRTLTVATTLVDAEAYPKEAIAELYGFRWNVELDIRSIKQSLNLGHVRCKSPEMVRREFWTTLLAYNLIRTTAAVAALLHDKQPRQISFVGACQYVLSTWMLFSCGAIAEDQAVAHCRTLLQRIAACKVADRPGRLEPRVLKRRRHRYKLMQESRAAFKRRLHKAQA